MKGRIYIATKLLVVMAFSNVVPIFAQTSFGRQNFPQPQLMSVGSVSSQGNFQLQAPAVRAKASEKIGRYEEAEKLYKQALEAENRAFTNLNRFQDQAQYLGRRLEHRYGSDLVTYPETGKPLIPDVACAATIKRYGPSSIKCAECLERSAVEGESIPIDREKIVTLRLADGSLSKSNCRHHLRRICLSFLMLIGRWRFARSWKDRNRRASPT